LKNRARRLAKTLNDDNRKAASATSFKAEYSRRLDHDAVSLQYGSDFPQPLSKISQCIYECRDFSKIPTAISSDWSVVRPTENSTLQTKS